MPGIFPVAGGKGGIGKSFITANLGWLLAKSRKTVLLTDLDLGSANLHTMLGIQDPGMGLSNFLNKTTPSLIEALTPCQITGLFLLSSRHCSLEAANLPYAQTQKIINAITRLPFDFVLLDLGAGTHFNTLDFFLSSTDVILVFTPEPTSIESGVRFIETVYYRKIKQLFKQHRLNAIINNMDNSTTPSLTNIVRLLSSEGEENGRSLFENLKKIRFKVIINQTKNQNSYQLGEPLIKLCRRHFFSNFELTGMIEYDEKSTDAIFSKELYVQKYPRSRTTYDLLKTAQNLMSGKKNNSLSPDKPFWDRNYYELLDIHPDTPPDDVEQAYKNTKSLYQDNPLIVDAFFSKEEKNNILEEIVTAGETLCDPLKRQEYDRYVLKVKTTVSDNMNRPKQAKPEKVDAGVLPKNTPQKACPTQPVQQNRLEMLALIKKISAQHIISGADLKNFRSTSGITFETIFEKTRIGATTLKVIEEDQFDALPPMIYLKGFLKAYAQALQLPVAAVVDGYLKNIEKHTVTGHP